MTVEMLLAAIGSLLAVIGGYIASTMAKLAVSVQELNVRIAVVISQLGDHNNRIEKLEARE